MVELLVPLATGILGLLLGHWFSVRLWRKEVRRQHLEERLIPIREYLADVLGVLEGLIGMRTSEEHEVPWPEGSRDELLGRARKLALHPGGGWSGALFLWNAELRSSYIQLYAVIAQTAQAIIAGDWADAIKRAGSTRDEIMTFWDQVTAMLEKA